MLGIDLMLPTRRIFTTVRFGLARPDMTLHITYGYITSTSSLHTQLHRDAISVRFADRFADSYDGDAQNGKAETCTA